MMHVFVTFVLSFMLVQNTHCKVFSDSPPSSCSSFSVSSCSPDQDELLDTFSFPPGTPDGPALCQATCYVMEGCQYFTYNSVSGTCDLYHYRYLESCQVI